MFQHFDFVILSFTKISEGECTGSGSWSKAKWNLATSKLFPSDVHENTNFNLTIDLFLYLEFHFGCVPFIIKVNYDPLCTSVKLCIISHATPMFFAPWINLWLCVDAGGGGGGGWGGWGTDLFSRGGISALEVGISNFPTSLNFLFHSHLINRSPKPWYVKTPV